MSNTEIKICQNCRQEFQIQPEDFDFYKKLDVPPPTYCPDCRLQRRIMWRCERSLYKRACNLCGKNIISIYSTDKPHKVYCRECFHGDAWDPIAYGREYDFTKPFFQQFQELQLAVPRQYAFAFQNINSDYCNGAACDKNCYLIFVSDHDEDCFYSYTIFDCRNSADLLNCNECELCFECVTCKKCYQSKYSQDCASCRDVIFCKNCVNCSDCVGSANLRNARYCVFNKQYSKEDYEKKLKELQLDTMAGVATLRQVVADFWPKFPSKYIHGFQNLDVVGDYTFNSKNTYRTYDSELLEDCKFLNHGNKARNCYDAYVCVDGSENSYEFIGGLGLNNMKFGLITFNNFDCTYTDGCENSSNLLGCVSLKKKEYCILNRQYSKEDYLALYPRIIKHMDEIPLTDSQGRVSRYGEFFPPTTCIFGYNETAAQEYFPLTKEQALQLGYKWKDPEGRDYKVTIQPGLLPGHISQVQDSIIGEVIGCEHGGTCADGCTTAFRITPEELQLYRRLNVPPPHLCFNCRHVIRLKQRNPLTLTKRKCMCKGEVGLGITIPEISEGYRNRVKHAHGDAPCPTEFETTYAAERSETVYCEQCYNNEMA